MNLEKKIVKSDSICHDQITSLFSSSGAHSQRVISSLADKPFDPTIDLKCELNLFHMSYRVGNTAFW
jgi:hypothetical protein